MNDEVYTICNESTHRSYPAVGKRGADLELIWASEKCWFTPGNVVTITGEDGRKKTFTK